MKKTLLLLLMAVCLLSVTLSSCGSPEALESTNYIYEDDEYIDESGSENTSEDKQTESESTTGSTASKTTSVTGNTTAENSNITIPKMTLKNKKVKLMHSWDSQSEWLKDWSSAFSKDYGGTVELVYANAYDKATRLAAMKASKTSPDLVFGELSREWPMLIQKNVVIPVDDKIDFSLPLWKDTKAAVDNTKIGGKAYFAVTEVTTFSSVCYNKKALREAGLEEPRALYYKGQWTWDKFEEYAKKLTNASAGTSGFTSVYPEGLILSTGKDLIEVTSNSYKINLNDPDIIRSIELIRKLGPSNLNAYKLLDGKTMFDELKRGKVAMLMTPNPHLYLADAFKARTVSYAPVPRDPKADKYYEPYGTKGFYIADGASNIDGAVAYINSVRYLSVPEINKGQRDKGKSLYGMTDEDYDLEEHRAKNTVPVTLTFDRLQPDITYEVLWSKLIKENRSWSSVVEEYNPQIQSLIDKVK